MHSAPACRINCSQEKADGSQADQDDDIRLSDTGSFNRPHTATQWLHEGGFVLGKASGNRKGNALDMRGRNSNKLGEATRVEIGFPKL